MKQLGILLEKLQIAKNPVYASIGKENVRFLYYQLSVERNNARVSRDFQLERHYMRGLETMQMRVALSLSVMLAMACTSQPQRMRSLIVPLAA